MLTVFLLCMFFCPLWAFSNSGWDYMYGYSDSGIMTTVNNFALIVQGQHPANLSHCIFEQIEVMIIYPRRKNCSQHWYWKINVVAVLWLSIKLIVFYQTYRDDQTKGIRIK